MEFYSDRPSATGHMGNKIFNYQCQGRTKSGKLCTNKAPWRAKFCKVHDKPAERARVIADLQGADMYAALRLLERASLSYIYETVEAGKADAKYFAGYIASIRCDMQEAYRAGDKSRFFRCRAYWRSAVFAQAACSHKQRPTERAKEYHRLNRAIDHGWGTPDQELQRLYTRFSESGYARYGQPTYYKMSADLCRVIARQRGIVLREQVINE